MLNTTERLEAKEQALHEVDRTKKYISGARKFLGEGKIGLAIERCRRCSRICKLLS